MGELRLLRTQIARYEPGAVAHIENVLASEERLRQHVWRQLSERIVERETDESTESLQDLQSVERHELEREIQAQSTSEFQARAGFNLTASYGDTVTLGLSAEVGTSETREQSQRSAERYAKELTSRSLERITRRVRELQRTRTVQEAEERNRHKFDNTAAGSVNIAGVYRWVDALHRAKLVVYGQRVLYDFVVPEPATYLRQVTALKHDLRGEVLQRPDEPTATGADRPLRPDDIRRDNYTRYLASYGATDVPTPPPEYVMLAHTVVEKAPATEGEPFPLIFSDELELPAGYRAAWAYVPSSPARLPLAELRAIGAHWREHSLEIPPDRLEHWPEPEPHRTYRPESARIFKLSGETGTLPVVGERLGPHPEVALAVEVLCELDRSYYEKWQLEVYAAVMRAHRAAVGAYEDRLLSAKLDGSPIGTLNPELNRRLALQELKRCCLSMWVDGDLAATASHLPTGDEAADGDGPPDAAGSRRPVLPERIDVAGALAHGRRARFLESAFEWGNAQVELYPYYWGRAPGWAETMQAESPDPQFQAFLQAGSARVSVPCQPEMAAQVLFYQLTGVMWDAGEPPVIVAGEGDALTPEEALYNAYLDDLADDTHTVDVAAEPTIAADDPDSWLVRVPTAAVWLAPDADLPDLERERATPREG